MAFRFKVHEGVSEGILRIIAEEAMVAVEQLAHSPAKRRDEAVHEARKSLKKVRGILKLVRSELGPALYRKENGILRDTARVLSELRDAGAIIETFDTLAAKYNQDPAAAGLGVIRKALVKVKREKERSLNITRAMSASATQFRSLLRRMSEWPLAVGNFSCLAPGLRATYRQGRRAMKRARRSQAPADYHEWRKRAKDHWYHMRLLENVWTEATEAREKSIHELESSLGEDHNLFVLCEQLQNDPDRYGGNHPIELFSALASKEQQHLRTGALALGARIYEEKSGPFVASMEQLWHTWKTESKARKVAAKSAAKQLTNKPADTRVA